MTVPTGNRSGRARGGRNRGRLRARVAVAAIGVVLGSAGLIGGVPEGQAQDQRGLPAVGAEIPIGLLALDAPTAIRTAQVNLDFRGGMRVRVLANPANPENSRRLKVIGHRVTAELPDIGDYARQSGGTVTIEQNDVDAKSTLTLTDRSTNAFSLRLSLSFTMTIDQPDDFRRMSGSGAGRIYEPLVLTTKEPQILVGTIYNFPPKGAYLRQLSPVDLVLPDDPDTVLAQIERFPVKASRI
ncbi:hypothetical protein [Crossiella sp. CA198]|uniref:hypothetical protein n=1 Tax=Crossiella sp. CA198 TaxID=3455607 RepID=UPI003F8D22BA